MKHSKELQAKFQSLHKVYFKDTPKALFQPISYAMESGGKYIRPLLMIFSNEMFGGKIEDVITNAYGIELFHNFTLVHDDIMDNSAVRRGKETVYKKFGLNSGILSGDFMFITALQMACKLNGKTSPDLFDLISKTAIEIHEGQQMDVDFETLERVSEEEYIKMIEFKTAVLLACSLQMGANIAGASQEDQKKIYEFGRLLGIAFQIQDDYLDTFGDNQLGKRIGGDILNNKKTLLFIASLDLGSKEEKRDLLQWYTSKGGEEEEKISSVKSIFESSGAKAYCVQKMKDLIDKSLLNLEAIETTRSKSELMGLADLIIQRRN